MDAPKVVAKGLRLVAQRIKELARENGVPVIERPQVARNLYKHVEIGHAIPAAFYETVAEILAYLYRLRQGGLVRRKHATA
jgi:flagellar biosynthetic protein FlhB